MSLSQFQASLLVMRSRGITILAKKADLSSIFSSPSEIGPTYYNPVRLSHLKRLDGYIEVKLTDTQIAMNINIQDVSKAIVDGHKASPQRMDSGQNSG
eukprot:4344399-Prymnesium_polylepis.1